MKSRAPAAGSKAHRWTGRLSSLVASVAAEAPTDNDVTSGLEARPARAGRLSAPFGEALFALGLIVLASGQVLLSLLPTLARDVPVEADDAYTYIVKAAEMDSCFLQNCAALSALRAELQEPTTDADLGWTRYREYHRAFVVYHPLHSAVLVGLHRFGFTWEQAYNAVAVAGAAFIAAAAGLWLRWLWGAETAGLSMLLLSVAIFPHQGLHYVVPTNLALGIGMLTWGAVARWRERFAWFLVPAALAMLAMHPAGLLYAAIAAILLLALCLPRPPRSVVLALATTGLVTIAWQALPYLVSRPDLVVRADPAPPGWSVWQGLFGNAREAAIIVRYWLRWHGGYVGASLLLSLGLIGILPSRRRALGATATLLVGVLLVSLAQTLPRYAGELFARIWVPVAIMLTACLARGLLLLCEAAVGRRKLPTSFEPVLGRGRRLRAALVVFALAGFLEQGDYFWRETSSMQTDTYAWWIRYMTDTQQLSFAADQPVALLALSAPSDLVVYDGEQAMHYFLSRGLLDRPAIYLPAMADTSLAHLAQNRAEARFAVVWSPLGNLGPNVRRGSLGMPPGSRLTLRSSRRPDSNPSLLLKNWNRDFQRLSIRVSGDSEAVREVDLAPLEARWVELSIDGQWCNLEIALDGGRAASVAVQGIRVSPGAKTVWPWNQGVSVDYAGPGSADRRRMVEFSPQELVPGYSGDVEVVGDGGDTVVIDLRPSRAARSPGSSAGTDL